MSVDRSLKSAQWLLEEHAHKHMFTSIPGRAKKEPLPGAYDIQERFVTLLRPQYGATAGFKIGLTSPRMQQMCGIDQPIAGAVLEGRIHHSPAAVSLADFVRLGVECELAVQVSSPLSGTVSLDRVGRCISAVAAAFELVEDRLADYRSLDIFSLVADNSWNAGVILGKPQPLEDVVDLQGSLEINGHMVDRGSSRDVLGHPLAAVAWLSEHLGRRGHRLEAGQWVMTGSIVPTRFPNAGDRFKFSLGPLSPVELELSTRDGTRG